MKPIYKKVLMVVCFTLLSICTFYGVNLLMIDIGNHEATLKYIPVTLAFFMVVCNFIRLMQTEIGIRVNPDNRDGLISKLNLYLIINSSLGIVFSVFTAIIYGSLFKPYPFFAFVPAMLVVHCATLVIAILKKKKENNAKLKQSIKEKLWNVIEWILLLYAFNKLGGFFLSPLFIERAKALEMLVYILGLLVPIMVVNLIIVVKINILNPIQLLLRSIILTLCSLIFCLLVALMGMKDQGFVSAVSVFVPLERLAVTPFDSGFFRPALTIIPSLTILIISIVRMERSRKQASL